MRRVNDLTGKTFSRLTVLKRAENDGDGHASWLCSCECGGQTITRGQSLLSKKVESCGCLNREKASERMTISNTKHGGRKTRLYRIWVDMRNRCSYPNTQEYRNYGGRGITVCPEWMNNFAAFRDWAIANGYQDDLTIDRINNDGNYEPSNCQWLTRSENCKKKSA